MKWDIVPVFPVAMRIANIKCQAQNRSLINAHLHFFSVIRELGGTWLYQFSNAAVTTGCKFSGSKPLKLILLQFRKSEVRNESNGAKSKVWAGRLLLEAPEEVCFLASPYRTHFLARGPHLILSGPASPPTSHCGHATFSLRLSWLPIVRIPVIAFGSIQIIQDILSSQDSSAKSLLPFKVTFTGPRY